MSFATWTIGPSASTAEEVAERDALRARYLTPHVTTVREYQDRLNSYARRQSVPALKGVPIFLHPGEDIDEDDRMFIRWAHRARRLSSMDALRASAAVVNVRLERKLRFDFAKLKASGQLKRLYPNRYAEPTVPTSHVATPTGDKRLGSATDLASVAQKRPRRMDSLVVGDPQTPMSYKTRSNPATESDIGFGLDDDVAEVSSPHETVSSLARRAQPEVVGVTMDAHEELKAELASLRETVVRLQAAHEQSETEVRRLRELQAPSRSIESVDQRFQKVEYLFPQLDGRVGLLTQMVLPGARPRACLQAPPSPPGKDRDTA